MDSLKRDGESDQAAKDRKRQYCAGCRDDFYNQPGNSTTGECWLLKDAQIVARFRLHWWTAPTVPGAFTEVITLHCHRAPGRYAHYTTLPDFAVNPRRTGESAGAQ